MKSDPIKYESAISDSISVMSFDSMRSPISYIQQTINFSFLIITSYDSSLFIKLNSHEFGIYFNNNYEALNLTD